MRYEREIEGCIVEYKPDSGYEIEPGDLYIGERNTGPQLLICLENDRENNWVVPASMAYSYDTWECKLVIAVDGVKVNRK
jgi:hypothetical protein